MDDLYFFPLRQFRRRKIRRVASGAASENIDDVGVASGYFNKVVRLAVENATHNFTSFRFGVWDGSTFHPLGEQTSPLLGVLYWTVDPFYLSDDQRLRIVLVGCTASDVVNVYIDEFYKEV